jgi:hypothetical protein
MQPCCGTSVGPQEMRLTDKFVKGAPGAGDYSDDLVRGFFLRVGASGAKSFGVRYRSPVLIDEKSHGKRQRYTIGTASAWSLSDAREKARSILQQVADGTDPQAKKVEARAVGNSVETVADILEHYIVKIRSDEHPREHCQTNAN